MVVVKAIVEDRQKLKVDDVVEDFFNYDFYYLGDNLSAIENALKRSEESSIKLKEGIMEDEDADKKIETI